ncbi:MAG: Fe-S oxidoreductase, partial [Chitinophagaceae bacterium]
MHWLHSLVFIAVTITAFLLFLSKVREIRRNILLGREADFSGHRSDRWKNVLLLALGQKKMFRYPGVAILHLMIYVGFIVINIELLEIIGDGLLHKHRFLHPYLGSAYPLLINAFELLAVIVILACILFLIRRNLLGLKRFSASELDGWPRSDAHLILIIEIILMTLFLSMNASDRLLQIRQHPGYTDTGDFLISGQMTTLFLNFSSPALVGIERSCWWLHILGIYAFLNYLPWSKH